VRYLTAGAATTKNASARCAAKLLPYAIYVPSAGGAHGGYALTLLLHSLSANYNQFSG